MSRLLVVAGEGSGDAFAAPVIARLGVPSFGVGGTLLSSAGTDVLADILGVSAMGLFATAGRALCVARALSTLALAVRRERPKAALLVGLSEVNARLAPWLRARGTRVLWYAPPQVWAWRPGRARSLARAGDRLAVVLPFEAPLWQRAGACVDYVGHPSLSLVRSGARKSAGRPSIAVLPGSRRQEVLAHLPRMLEAVRELARRGGGADATVVRARALDRATAAWMVERADDAGLPLTDAPIEVALGGCDAALVSGGTATLECAVLAVPPVIVYRTDPVTFSVARRMVRVPHIGLPNLVLGRAAFPELLQHAATPGAMARALAAVLERPDACQTACAEVKAALEADLDERAPDERVAALLAPWLD